MNTFPDDFSSIYFIDVRGSSFSPYSSVWQEKINDAIYDILNQIKSPPLGSPALLKCHIGEPKNTTRMLSEYCVSTVKFLNHKGVTDVVTGDTTVAYSGRRSHKLNTAKDCSSYISLADEHGWGVSGPLKLPFVILDRPSTSIKGRFEFDTPYITLNGNFGRFKEIYSAGGFEEARAVYNHVHLTLHITSHHAAAVKGIAMGMAPYEGKTLMHQHYYPVINDDKCVHCGECASVCPIQALSWEKNSSPSLSMDKCIGCGECMTVCAEQGKAISMGAQEQVNGWDKDPDMLPYRISDYATGLMQNKFDKIIHIVHMYNITKYCDCFNKQFEPIFKDIGFLIGRNPFALDFYSRYLLSQEIYRNKTARELSYPQFLKIPSLLTEYYKGDSGDVTYKHILNYYGIPYEGKIINRKL